MLNNISFLALFVFLTPCFASDPTKIHSAFSHLVRPFAIYAQCGLILFLFRQNNDDTPNIGYIRCHSSLISSIIADFLLPRGSCFCLLILP